MPRLRNRYTVSLTPKNEQLKLESNGEETVLCPVQSAFTDSNGPAGAIETSSQTFRRRFAPYSFKYRTHCHQMRASPAPAGPGSRPADDAGACGGRRGPAAGPRIPVSHIGGRLLGVHLNAADRGPPLHFGQGPPKDGRHHEHVRDAVALQHLRQNFRTRALSHRPTVPLWLLHVEC